MLSYLFPKDKKPCSVLVSLSFIPPNRPIDQCNKLSNKTALKWYLFLHLIVLIKGEKKAS